LGRFESIRFFRHPIPALVQGLALLSSRARELHGTLIRSPEVVLQKSFLPAVNKLGREGYDGRGVQVLRTEKDLEKASSTEPIGKAYRFRKEIAVIVAGKVYYHHFHSSHITAISFSKSISFFQ